MQTIKRWKILDSDLSSLDVEPGTRQEPDLKPDADRKARSDAPGTVGDNVVEFPRRRS